MVYLLARRLLGCLIVLARREVSKDSPMLLVKGSGLGECPGGPAAPQENGVREAAG